MKKITFLLLTILPFLSFGQTTIATYTFASDNEAWLSAGADPVYDAANYYTAAGSVIMVADLNKLISTPKLDIAAPGTYTFTFRVKGAVGTIIRSQFKEFDNGGLATNGDSFTVPATGGDAGGDGGTWFELTQTEDISVAGEVAFRIQSKTASTATFYIDDVTVVKESTGGNTLTVDAVGSGMVAKTLDKISYDQTDNETLTATPSTHWNFDNWSGDLTGSTNPDDILMDTDKTVTATFSIDPSFDYAFTFDSDPDLEGWTSDPQLAVTAHTGGKVTLTPTTDQWARFSLFDFPIPSASYNKVTVTLENSSTNDDQVTAIVVNGGSTEVLEPQIMTAGIGSYEFDLTAATNWTGDVDSIRIRFSDADNPTAGRSSGTGNIIMDNITFDFDASLSSNDFKTSSFSLYPNPVRDIVYINSINTIFKVELFEITGKRVLQNVRLVNNAVDVSQLRTGMYIMRLSDVNGASSTKKLMIK